MDVPDEEHVPIEKHEATDRFGKAALRAAHDLGRALAEGDARGDDAPGRASGRGEHPPDVEPVVLRTRGPHRTIGGLAALIDAVLDDPGGAGGEAEARSGERRPEEAGRAGPAGNRGPADREATGSAATDRAATGLQAADPGAATPDPADPAGDRPG